MKPRLEVIRRALAALVYTAVRVGAVVRWSVGSLTHDGTQYMLRFAEKGESSRKIPVRHNLKRFLLDYIRATGMTDGPCFAPRRAGREG